MNEVVREEVVALAKILTDPDISKASIEQRVADLEGEALPKIIVRAREVQGFAKHVIDTGEAELRIRAAAKLHGEEGHEADAVVVPGQRWVDTASGVIHRFEGDLSEWKVDDAKGLRLALADLKRRDGTRYLEDRDIDRAIPVTYKPDHRVLNEFEKIAPEVRDTIASFRRKDRGPAHLREEKA